MFQLTLPNPRSESSSVSSSYPVCGAVTEVGDDQSSVESTEFCGEASLTNYVNSMLTSVVEATKAHLELPTGQDYRFHTVFRDFPKAIQSLQKQMETIMQSCAQRTQKKAGRISIGFNDENELYDVVSSTVERLLEDVDNNIDVMKGKRRKKGSSTNFAEGQLNNDLSDEIHISASLRPQLLFQPPCDNSDAPFRVRRYDPLTGKLKYGDPEVHYFREEILDFQPSKEQLFPSHEQLYSSLEETSFEWIDTLLQLENLVAKLSKCSEIAVDIEAHDYRSFQGFCCLVQFSSRNADYIVDVLKLRDSFHLMLPVFSNPNITKVMHGAHHDIVWLQRDFGIFVVNLFDTSCASKILHFPRLGLDYLLQYFCQRVVTKKKMYQTSDWRVRPIPRDMLEYAREDTHYLLYIYDRMRVLLNQESLALGQTNLAYEAIEQSKLICLKLYSKPQFDPNQTYLYFLHKHMPLLSRQQVVILNALLRWRHQTAAKVDESYGYVLPSGMAISIARTNPTTLNELLGCCHPVPPLLRASAKEVLSLIQAAAASELDQSPFPLRLTATLSSQPALSSATAIADTFVKSGSVSIDSTELIPLSSSTLIPPKATIVAVFSEKEEAVLPRPHQRDSNPSQLSLVSNVPALLQSGNQCDLSTSQLPTAVQTSTSTVSQVGEGKRSTMIRVDLDIKEDSNASASFFPSFNSSESAFGTGINSGKDIEAPSLFNFHGVDQESKHHRELVGSSLFQSLHHQNIENDGYLFNFAWMGESVRTTQPSLISVVTSTSGESSVVHTQANSAVLMSSAVTSSNSPILTNYITSSSASSQSVAPAKVQRLNPNTETKSLFEMYLKNKGGNNSTTGAQSLAPPSSNISAPHEGQEEALPETVAGSATSSILSEDFVLLQDPVKALEEYGWLPNTASTTPKVNQAMNAHSKRSPGAKKKKSSSKDQRMSKVLGKLSGRTAAECNSTTLHSVEKRSAKQKVKSKIGASACSANAGSKDHSTQPQSRQGKRSRKFVPFDYKSVNPTTLKILRK